MDNIADIRRDYKLQTLNETDVEGNAIEQFGKWWQDAINSNIDEVNAITLATATTNGKPSARIVLLKAYDEKGFVFFTNYQSHKGKELADNPQACMVFFWKELERQVRVEGTIEKVSIEESDTYYLSRPAGSQIGAWASLQSQTLSSREEFERRIDEMEKRFENVPVPRPPQWSGFRVVPEMVEFWYGARYRLHERHRFDRVDGQWSQRLLYP